MQFRAGIVYVLLFTLVAAGAYGVIATADSPEVTVDQADADYELTEGDEFDVGGQTWNVTGLSDGSATVEHVEEGATFDVQWEGASAADDDGWDDGDTVQLEEEGAEYHVYIHAPPAGDGDEEDEGEEPAPEAFSLVGEIDEEEYEVLARDDGVYVTVQENDTETVVHVDDVDEIDSRTLENGDEVSFYEEEQESQVDGEVVDLSTDTVTVEYTGAEVTELELEHEELVVLDGEEFIAYFQNDDTVYLTSNVDAVEAQQEEREEFNDRIRGLWWVVAMAALTAITLAGLAYMPVRG